MSTCLKVSDRLRKDNGYSWFILSLSTISHCLHTGFSFAVIGNLTIQHATRFNITSDESSMISSLHTGFIFMLGPIASILVKKTSCRTVELLGGLLLVTGLGLCSLATKPWHVYILFSSIAGFGVSCCYIASSEILSHHFYKFMHLSFSLAILGNYIGVAVWSSVSQLLFDKYGYSKTMLIMASLHAVHLVSGLFYIQPIARLRYGEYGEMGDLESRKVEADDINHFQSSSCDATNEIVNEKVHKTINKTVNETVNEICDDRKDSLTRRYLNLVKNPQVWAVMLNCFLFALNISSFFILSNGYSREVKGFSGSESALGVTIVGAASVFGALATTLTGSLSYNRLTLYTACSAIYGLTTIVIPFVDGKVSFYCLAAVWGIFYAVQIATLLSVAHEFCDSDDAGLLFSLQLVGEGIGGLLGAKLCETVIHYTSERYILVISGCTGVLASIVMLPVVCKKLLESRNSEQSVIHLSENEVTSYQ